MNYSIWKNDRWAKRKMKNIKMQLDEPKKYNQIQKNTKQFMLAIQANTEVDRFLNRTL